MATRTLGSSLDLVVERLDALLDELVSLLAELEDVGALNSLGDELLDDVLNDARGGLVLVKGRSRDCFRVQDLSGRRCADEAGTMNGTTSRSRERLDDIEATQRRQQGRDQRL